MDDDTRERELVMDELDVASGGGAIAPLTRHARQFGRTTAHDLQGVCDDSV